MEDVGERRGGSTRIGLIGGLAFRAGVFYYEQLLRRHQAQRRHLDLVLVHADVEAVLQRVAAGDRTGLGHYLGGLANQALDAGAGLVAISAVAPHLAIKETATVARGPLVDILDAISSGVAAAGVRRVAVFGNRAVMETDIFGHLPEAMVVRPDQRTLDEVHAAYTDVALHGRRGTAAEASVFADAARRAMDRGAEAIVLAGTDLSSFYADGAPPFPCIDAAALHIDAIVRRAWGAG